MVSPLDTSGRGGADHRIAGGEGGGGGGDREGRGRVPPALPIGKRTREMERSIGVERNKNPISLKL